MIAVGMALWGLVTWLLVEVFVFLPLALAGLPVAWLAGRYAERVTYPSRVWDGLWVTGYKNATLNAWVGNYEDGIIQPGYAPLAWFIRNPVSNLRFVPVVSTLPSMKTSFVGSTTKVPVDGASGWFLAWANGYVGFRWQCATWGVWLGWKVIPNDAFGPVSDYRKSGIGTACQLLIF
jgi:hypothetical protein